jgi:hypothetical protein
MIRKWLISLFQQQTPNNNNNNNSNNNNNLNMQYYEMENKFKSIDSVLSLVSSEQNLTNQSKSFLFYLLLRNWTFLSLNIPVNCETRFKKINDFIFQRIILKELQKSNLMFVNSIDESSEKTVCCFFFLSVFFCACACFLFFVSLLF